MSLTFLMILFAIVVGTIAPLFAIVRFNSPALSSKPAAAPRTYFTKALSSSSSCVSFLGSPPPAFLFFASIALSSASIVLSMSAISFSILPNFSCSSAVMALFSVLAAFRTFSIAFTFSSLFSLIFFKNSMIFIPLSLF